jgi:hypothetical protein
MAYLDMFIFLITDLLTGIGVNKSGAAQALRQGKM